VKINGKAVARPISKGYVRLGRRWQAGDVVELSLQMPIEHVVAHPHVEQDAGKVALQRGPVVYCLEQCDHRADVRSIRLRDRAELKACFEKRFFGGAVVIEGEAQAAVWEDGEALYQPVGQAEVRQAKIRAIPYCLWDNRQAGAMTVWMARG
jgi:DUF1680 family protein